MSEYGGGGSVPLCKGTAPTYRQTAPRVQATGLGGDWDAVAGRGEDSIQAIFRTATCRSG